MSAKRLGDLRAFVLAGVISTTTSTPARCSTKCLSCLVDEIKSGDTGFGTGPTTLLLFAAEITLDFTNSCSLKHLLRRYICAFYPVLSNDVSQLYGVGQLCVATYGHGYQMVWKSIEHWPSTLEIKKTLLLVTIKLEFSLGMSLCHDQDVKQKPLWPLPLLFWHTWFTDTVSRSCQSIIGACVDEQVCIPSKTPWSLVSLDDICNDDSATQICFWLCLSSNGDGVTAKPRSSWPPPLFSCKTLPVGNTQGALNFGSPVGFCWAKYHYSVPCATVLLCTFSDDLDNAQQRSLWSPPTHWVMQTLSAQFRPIPWPSYGCHIVVGHIVPVQRKCGGLICSQPWPPLNTKYEPLLSIGYLVAEVQSKGTLSAMFATSTSHGYVHLPVQHMCFSTWESLMVGGALIQDTVQLNCSDNFCYLFLEETGHLQVPGVKAKDRWQLIGIQWKIAWPSFCSYVTDLHLKSISVLWAQTWFCCYEVQSKAPWKPPDQAWSSYFQRTYHQAAGVVQSKDSLSMINFIQPPTAREATLHNVGSISIQIPVQAQCYLQESVQWSFSWVSRPLAQVLQGVSQAIALVISVKVNLHCNFFGLPECNESEASFWRNWFLFLWDPRGGPCSLPTLLSPECTMTHWLLQFYHHAVEDPLSSG
jgi:hypothetical protein